MSSPSREWKLQPCAGSLKVWQDASDVYMVLFEHPRGMARLFGVGVPCSVLTVRKEGKLLCLFITQLTYLKWLELWQKESSGGPVPVSKFIAQCGNITSTSPSTSRPGTSSSSSSSALTSHPPGHSSGGASSSPHGGGTDISEELTFLTVDDGAGVPKLRISVLVGNKPGEGIAAGSTLVLAPNPEHHCALASDVDFLFSEHHPPPTLSQPIRRKMEVNIASRYGIPGTCLVQPVPPIIPVAIQPATHGPTGGGGAIQPTIHAPTGQQRVGIAHDNMYVNFECKENSLGSILLANEALDVITMNLSNKEGNARQRGWDGSLTVGSTSIAKADVKHTRASSSNETTALMRSHVIAGAQFQLWDICRKSAIAHALSYKATHRPPIEHVSKLEDAGLDTTPRDFVTSDVCMPINLKCKGEFLLIGSGLKKHTFEMGRSLAEFQVKVDGDPVQKTAKNILYHLHPSHPTLIRAKQKLEIDFIVNHDFDLRMYKDAHLYWLLVGAVESTPAPHVLDVLQGDN